MRESELTPAAVALGARKQWFMARLVSPCDGSKLKELYDHPTPGAPVGTAAGIEHARGRRADTMCWPDLAEEPVVKTTILEYEATAKRAAELCGRRKES